MIKQILQTIESALNPNRAENKYRCGFAWQSEFLFIPEKSKSSFSLIQSTPQPQSLFSTASPKKTA